MEITLSEQGLRVAHRLIEKQRRPEGTRFYPPCILSVCDTGEGWTHANDLLLVIGGFTREESIEAVSPDFDDVLRALEETLGPEGWDTPELPLMLENLVFSGFLEGVRGGYAQKKRVGRLANLCDVLGNPDRLKALLVWSSSSRRWRDLEEVMRLGGFPDGRKESFRRHLSILERAGFLQGGIQSRKKVYRIDLAAIGAMIDLLNSAFPDLYK